MKQSKHHNLAREHVLRMSRIALTSVAIVLFGCASGDGDDPSTRATEPDPEPVASETSTEVDTAVASDSDGAQSAQTSGTEEVAKTEQSLNLATALCAGTQWYAASQLSGSDKFKHCVATCKTTFWCGVSTASEVGVMKELVDTACAYAPDPVKAAIKSITGCGGWDWGDVLADSRGLLCGAKFWQSCTSCCGQYY